MEKDNTMKIYILQPLHEAGIEWLKERAEVIEYDDPRVEHWQEDADGIVIRGMKMPEEAMKKAKKLRVISKHGIGTDAIDLEAAQRLGIAVTNTPTGNVQSVAEQAVALMLAVSRRICEAHQRLKQGDLNVGMVPMDDPSIGCELFGKTVGLLGMGRIAIATGEILHKGFHMNVKAYAPDVRLRRWAAADYSIEACEDLKEMVKECDFISCHLPMKEQNRNLVNAEVLACCKPNAIIVNTGRGGVIDEDALYQALKTGKIQGAGLDVFVEEPVPPMHPLFEMENFVASPHNGANTTDALRQTSMASCENVYHYLTGKPVNAIVVEGRRENADK